MYEFLVGVGGGREGPAIFSAFACRGGAASTKIASWSWSCWMLERERGARRAARPSAIGAGRPDK